MSAPEYIFLISNLAGERRFAASVAKRLESLGALTHADRRATDTRDLSQFNVDNKYGRSALRSVYNSIIRGDQVIDGIPAPKNYDGNFFKDASDAMTDVGLLDTIEVSLSFNDTFFAKTREHFCNRIVPFVDFTHVADRNAMLIFVRTFFRE